MAFNFDEIIERTNTDSIKYDFAAHRGKPEGLLSLWVADMDFRTPSCVTDALVEKSRHGIFGYSESREDYIEVLQSWFHTRFGWDIKPQWLVKTPGVVYAIAMAIRALTEKGDAVIIQQPVYYPFTETINVNERKLIVNQLVYEDGAYRMDFDDFEDNVVRHGVKLFILCSPHNPVGRVWTRDELLRLGDICVKHDVVVVSDEIHADFVYTGHQHHVFASLKPDFADISITCTAPSKTFNLAGLQISNIFIPNAHLRAKFRQEIGRSGYSQLNIMGIIACKAAYRDGSPWLEELKTYLAGNLNLLRCELQEHIPGIQLIETQGTYLPWLDCSALGLSDKALDDFIVHKAKLWLDAGTMFGSGGEGFQRINIACPRSLLKQALDQLAQAIDEHLR